MYLSSSLKQEGHQVKLAFAKDIGLEKLKDLVESYSPEVIGYSVMTPEYPYLLETNKYLKKHFKFISIFGGPHPTFTPKTIEEDSCDAICIGEGEMVFTEFCRRVEANENYWETSNFIAKHDGEVFDNPMAPLIDDLDSIPFPDRSLMYDENPALKDDCQKAFYATRGCPYKCTYCFNVKYYDIYGSKGLTVRSRSPENLIAEMAAVKAEYPMEIVGMNDDTFLAKTKPWLENFTKLYKEQIDLPLGTATQPSLVNDHNISLLKEANVSWIAMGIEAGNEEIANTVLKRGIKNKQIEKAFKIINSYNITTVSLNLVGLPIKNSFEADLETLDFNLKVKPTIASCGILYPYPGAPITDYAREHGFLEKGKELEHLESNKHTSVFKFSSSLEQRKIENLHKLFPLVVEFPFLRRFVKFLCSLPLLKIYTPLYFLMVGFNYKMRIRPFTFLKKEKDVAGFDSLTLMFRFFVKEIGGYVRLWWKFVRQT